MIYIYIALSFHGDYIYSYPRKANKENVAEFTTLSQHKNEEEEKNH